MLRFAQIIELRPHFPSRARKRRSINSLEAADSHQRKHDLRRYLWVNKAPCGKEWRNDRPERHLITACIAEGKFTYYVVVVETLTGDPCQPMLSLPPGWPRPASQEPQFASPKTTTRFYLLCSSRPFPLTTILRPPARPTLPSRRSKIPAIPATPIPDPPRTQSAHARARAPPPPL